MGIVIAAIVLAGGLVAAALLFRAGGAGGGRAARPRHRRGRGRPAGRRPRRPARRRADPARRADRGARAHAGAPGGRARPPRRGPRHAVRRSWPASGPSSSACARSRPARWSAPPGMSAAQAKQALLRRTSRSPRATTRRRSCGPVEEETKREAERRVRSILSVAMQRLAAGHAAETTVSVVQLPSDDMKGRIIGREGRNIRALENLTGVDFIIDDTPNAVVLSAFDGVRREVARMTLEKLLQDGRIHPARIEETYFQTKSELEAHLVEVGEEAVLEAGVQGLDPELVRLLGRLRFRTSYGQNVLAHSVECAQLAAHHGPRARREPEDRAPRGAPARHRQGGLPRDRGPPRARRRRPRPPSRRDRGGRPRDGGPPQRGRAADRRGGHRPDRRRALAARAPGPAASRSSTTSSGCASSSTSPPATRASTRSTRCRPAARSASSSRRAPSTTTAPSALARAIAREIEQELEYPGQIKVTVIRECARGRLREVSPPPTLAGTMRRFHVTTFGCQMNEHDSERMQGMLEGLGYTAAERARRRRPDPLQHVLDPREGRRALRRAPPPRQARSSASRQDVVIGVGGCWAQSVKERRLPRSSPSSTSPSAPARCTSSPSSSRATR